MDKYRLWIRVAVVLLVGIGLSACHRVIRRPSAMPPALTEEALAPQVIPVRATTTLRAHYFYVGAGMCHVVECPGNNAPVLLDDCGSSNSDGGLSKDQAVAAVQATTAGRPVILVFSHSDADHSNYVPDIFPNPTPVAIRSIWGGGSYANYNDRVKTWLREARDAHIPIRMNAFPDPGVSGFDPGWSNDGNRVDALQCGTANTYVLTVNSTKGANAASMMLMIDHNGEKLLFPGDATGDAQAQAVENAGNNHKPANFLFTDVLEVSHHGAESNGSNNKAWAESTLPRYLLSSAGNSYYHPRCQAIQNYRDAIGSRLLGAPAHILYCGENGQWWKYENEPYAIFGTNSNGTLTVDVNAGGAGTRTTIYCGPNQCTN